jgi:hypothetical protein
VASRQDDPRIQRCEERHFVLKRMQLCISDYQTHHSVDFPPSSSEKRTMAGGGGSASGGSYSPLTGFVFIFNLIVGAGALTIPRAFAQVGLLYGALTLAALALSSYVTATFMVEAIAGANALVKRSPREVEAQRLAAKRGEKDSKALDQDDDDDDDEAENPKTEFMPLMVLPAQVLLIADARERAESHYTDAAYGEGRTTTSSRRSSECGVPRSFWTLISRAR